MKIKNWKKKTLKHKNYQGARVQGLQGGWEEGWLLNLGFRGATSEFGFGTQEGNEIRKKKRKNK